MAKVLVVEDEQSVCDMLQAELARHGHEVFIARGGQTGVELFRQHRFRITLLDLGLQDKQGLSVLKQIRTMDPEASIIILTEEGSEALESQARQLGASDFLRKTFSLDRLMDSLDRASARPGQAVSSHPVQESAKAEKTGDTILVVDDEPLLRGLLSQFLTLRGYRVKVAQDGPEALAMVAQEQPRMVILDLYMPGMNGVEVLRRLIGMPYKGGVIVLTASQDEPLLQETLDLGSVDVLGKPVDLERLALVIQIGLTLTDCREYPRKASA